jgi:GTP-binding protein Era
MTDRCGFLAIVGRPNVGKSTLLNALVGQKVSITSRKSQTTQHNITGIRNDDTSQLIFIDTPGFQNKYKGLVYQKLNKLVSSTLYTVDLILLVVEAGQFINSDQQMLHLLTGSKKPVFLVANKVDKVTKRLTLLPWLQEMQERFLFTQLVPLSAYREKDINHLINTCKPYLPEQPWIYSTEMLTDKNERFLVAEVVREKVFRLMGDEIPYSCTIEVDKFHEEQSKKYQRFLDLSASILVERPSHKLMIIGHHGERIKRIGIAARQTLQKLLGGKVHLDLWVKVKSVKVLSGS